MMVEAEKGVNLSPPPTSLALITIPWHIANIPGFQYALFNFHIV